MDAWLILLACLVVVSTDLFVVCNPMKIINKSNDKSVDTSDALKFVKLGCYCLRMLLVGGGCAPKATAT